jgi:type II secretory pathway pseudopilin PulG
MDIPALLATVGITELPLQAAAIQGLFAVVGVVLTGLVATFAYSFNKNVDRRVQAALRAEKTRDLQGAVRAEARAHWYELDSFGSFEALTTQMVEKIEANRWTKPAFTPFIIRQAESVVFEAIERDIAILDHEVIQAVINYYRQLGLAAQFAEDLRSDRFQDLPADRKIEMVRSYFAMLAVQKQSAWALNAMLETALKLKRDQRDANMLAWAPSSLGAVGRTGASAFEPGGGP